MEFRVLGPVELVVGGRVVAPPSRRRRRLLAALLARAGQVAAADQLIDAVWGQDPPRSAQASLQSHVSRLRARMRELDADQERIVTRGGGYGLVLTEGDEVDAVRFEDEVAEARALVADDPAAAVDLVDQALARWRGTPYVDAREAVEDEVGRLWSVHRAAQEVRIEALLAAGRAEAAIGELQARLEQDPLDERAVGQLMLAEFRCGRQAQAISTFHDFRRRLGAELGVDPSPWLQGRYDALVRHDEDLVSSAPALPTPRPVPEELGTAPGWGHGQATSFVGRATDVTDVAGLLASASLVTLTGPGGVGKSRLATAVAGTVAEVFDDVIVLELAAVRDRSALGAAVAGACGLVPGDDTALRDRLVDVLRARPVMVVADNCEHLLPDVAELVEHLLGRCPRLTILATSRERLAVPGEHRWPVAPLRLPPAARPPTPTEVADAPAVRVFCDRAAAADPTFELTADNAGTVTEVCRRLDGLPLALELAAARMAAFTVEELARRLDARFELLTTGPRHEGGRHRTLRDVVAWSYDLLSPAAADLFDLLSVFAGGFTLRSAEEVVDAVRGGPRGDVASALAELVDGSMVVRSGARYAILETLRMYGADRLAERGELDAAKQAHARHLAAFSERAGRGVRGVDDDRWAPRLEAELDNLRAAHRWAMDAGDADLALRLSAPLGFYADLWLVDEIHTWAEEAAGLPDATGHRLLPLALGTAARGAGNRGQLSRSVDLAREGLAAAGEDESARILPLRAWSLTAFYDGRLETSADLEAQGLALAEATGDQYHVVYAWVMRALIATYRGEPDAGLAAAERAVREADRLGNTHMRALAAYCRGEALAPQDPAAALPWLGEAVEGARRMGARLVEAISLVTWSSVHAERGEPQAALDAFREVITRLRRGGNWTHQWTALRNLVFLLVRLGADEEATELIGAIETTSTAARVYGEDATRLQEVVDRLHARLGPARYTEARDRGRRMDDIEALDAALAAIAALRATAT